jgi:predicted nucleic acid-binding Zn ribbon protein
MKKSNQQSLGEAIREFLQTHHLEEKMAETRIAALWEKAMGSHIARYTTAVAFRKGVLTITLNSPALRQELSYGKKKIADMINQELDQTLVEEVRLM